MDQIRTFLNCLVTATAASLCAAMPVFAQTAIATYRMTPGVATFGLPLPRGAAVEAVQVGSLPTQTDVKTTWPDGSIRFAVVTCQVATDGMYPIVQGSRTDGSVTPALPSSNVRITVDGVNYTSTLPSTISDLWLDGPLVREGRAVTAFSPQPPGAAEQLRVIWDVRSYRSGGHRVSVTLDNTRNVAAANVVVYSAAVTIAGQSVFTKNAVRTAGRSTLSQAGGEPVVSTSHGLVEGDWVRLTSGPKSGQFRRVNEILDADRFVLNAYFSNSPTGVTWERISFLHPYMARWRKAFVVAPLTESTITPDFTPFYSAKAVSSYVLTIPGSKRTVAGWKYDVLGIGDLTYPLSRPGDRDEIGLFPAFVAQYLNLKTPALREYVLRMGDLAGTFSIHLTEADGAMLSLDNHPEFVATVQGNGNSGPAGGGPETFGRGYYGEGGAAHQPSLACMPYLLTGDRYYLDELKAWANYGMLSWGWLRRGSAGLVTAQQMRGTAWALRDIAQAAAFTPDDDPSKAYFMTRVLANLRDLDARAATETDPLGAAYAGLRIEQPKTIQVFMQSMLLWVIDYTRDLGFDSAGDAYRVRIATYFNNLQNAQGFDWKAAGSYYIQVVDGAGNYFRSYADLYNFNFGGSSPLYKVTPLVPVHYGVNLRIILIVATKLGLPNAAGNLARLMAYRSPDGYSMVDELVKRQQYAITGGPPGDGPATPEGVRIR